MGFGYKYYNVSDNVTFFLDASSKARGAFIKSDIKVCRLMNKKGSA
jgi:hypothetical protein